MLSMDEQGTKAATASVAVLLPRSLTIETGIQMIVNRPYLVIIRDQHNQRPLFMAYVTDPSLG